MAYEQAENTKVRISIDGIEVEAQGTQDFVESKLPELISKIVEMRRAIGPAPNARSSSDIARAEGESSILSFSNVSTNTIASLMNASTGSDLVMAAMAHLTLVQRKDTGSRREILDEMRAAKTFYKETFGGNLTSYLDSLAKQKRLNLVSKDAYALPNAERQSLERLIANAG